MKTIGLIGGMSWESTAEYYRLINEEVKNRLGGLHSAKCILYSVDFHEIERYQSAGEWEKAGEVLGIAANSLEKAGADFLVLCTNTMHKVVNQLGSALPLVHIADATAEQIKKQGLKTVGLLGTKYTMEQDFYKARIEENGIKVIVPGSINMDLINKVIFDELCLGTISPVSREYFKRVIRDLAEIGAEGIILGCTEIGLLIKEADSPLPLFDTAKIHAIEAVNEALK